MSFLPPKILFSLKKNEKKATMNLMELPGKECYRVVVCVDFMQKK